VSDKFKRAVRERMDATGENYTAARKALLLERAIAGDALSLADLQRTDAKLYRVALQSIQQANEAALDAALVSYAMKGGTP